MSEATTTGTESAPPTTVLAPEDGRGWLPEEFRADPTFKDIADPAALAKSYKNAAALVGLDKGEVIRLPKDATPEAMAEVYARLGRPEKPEGYEVKGPDGLTPEVLSAFQQTAHSLGLSKAQAAGLMEFYGQGVEGTRAQQAAAQAAALDTGLAKVKEEWGAAYADRAAGIVQLVTQVAGPNSLGSLDALIAAGDLPMLNLLAKAADSMLEKGLKGGGQGNIGGTMTPAEAQAAIEAWPRDETRFKQWMNADDPGHAAAMAEWTRLHELAHPKRAA